MDLANKYGKKYIGRSFVTNEGYRVDVVGCGSTYGHVNISFSEPVGYNLEVSTGNLKAGRIRNNYHRSAYSKGFFGLGEYSAKAHPKHYFKWREMLRRSYDEKFHDRYPTYRNVEVCDEWLDFQKFSMWFDLNHINGWELDKDVLSSGNKIYSPETSVFIPKYLNRFMASDRSSNKSGCTGVFRNNERNRYIASVCNSKNRINSGYIGSYVSIEEASNAYIKGRSIAVMDVSIKYAKDAIKMNISNDLINKVINKIK